MIRDKDGMHFLDASGTYRLIFTLGDRTAVYNIIVFLAYRMISPDTEAGSFLYQGIFLYTVNVFFLQAMMFSAFSLLISPERALRSTDRYSASCWRLKGISKVERPHLSDSAER